MSTKSGSHDQRDQQPDIQPVDAELDSDPPLRVYLCYLTDTVASEHLYGRSLKAALAAVNVHVVDDWREADVIHLLEVNFFTRDAIASFTFPTLFRMLRSEVPVVVSTDDLYFIDEPNLTARPALYRWNSRAQRWLFNRCDAIIAISESVKRALIPALSNATVYVVHHGVDDRYFAKPVERTDPYVLHVSLASKRKNPDAILEIADRLDQRFVIAGGGWDAYVSEQRYGGSVEVRGFVPEADLIELYRNASVFYFPTLHEGFGLPLLEAMASGTAVVSSDVYAVPEVVGDAGILHDPFDVSAHLDSIDELLTNADYRTGLAEQAWERAWAFSWTDTAVRTKWVYQTVIEGHSSDVHSSQARVGSSHLQGEGSGVRSSDTTK